MIKLHRVDAATAELAVTCVGAKNGCQQNPRASAFWMASDRIGRWRQRLGSVTLKWHVRVYTSIHAAMNPALRMVRVGVGPNNVLRRCQSVDFLSTFMDIDCPAIKDLAV